MKHFKRLLGLAVVVGLCVLTSSAAFAADPTFEIDIQGALSSIVTVVFAAVAGLVTWAVRKISNIVEQKFGMEIEDSMRQYVNDAIINGLHYARDAVVDKTKSIDNPDVKQDVIATAANYVLTTVPDALVYFGLDNEEKVKSLVLSRLPQIVKS